MTRPAQIHAHLDGSGTLTTGDRTQTVQAEGLSDGLAQLMALAVAEAARLGHPLDVVADLEDSPSTGLHVEPDGQITEDPSILRDLSLLTAAAPNAATSQGVQPRRLRRGVAVGAVAVALVAAAGTWAALRDGETPPAATTVATSSSPEPAPTQAVTQAATPTPPASRTTATASPRIRVRVQTTGGREEARFRLVASQRASVQLTTWRRGDLAADRTRRVRMRAGIPVVVQLQNLPAGQWLWRVRGERLKPTNGRVQVDSAPVAETTPPSPTVTPTITPTYTPAPQPTRSPTPQPTRPAPVKPTGGPVKPDDNGPQKP